MLPEEGARIQWQHQQVGAWLQDHAIHPFQHIGNAIPTAMALPLVYWAYNERCAHRGITAKHSNIPPEFG